MSESLLDAKQVTKLTTLHVSTIYRMMNANQFPRPLQIAAQTVRWKASDIDEWINSRPRASCAG